MKEELSLTPNYTWIYTYDYAPDSVWEPWRDKVYGRTALHARGEPYWIENEACAVADRVRKRGERAELPAFLLLADSHFTHNGTWEDTLSSMRALAKHISLSGIIHLGDLTDGLLPAERTKELTEKLCGDMEAVALPLYLVPGNHDYNYFRGNPELIYPRTPQYYADFPAQRLRLVFIDSFDPKEAWRYGFTEYCVHWLDACLRLLPAGYACVIFSHVPPLVRLQAWTDNIRNREKLVAVLDAHADKILAFIHGHNHCDLLFNELRNGQFPVVSINCAKCEYFTEHKPEGAVVPYRRLGDRTQESFDIMQVDTKKRKIYFTRFGAGQDRVVKDRRAFWV